MLSFLKLKRLEDSLVVNVAPLFRDFIDTLVLQDLGFKGPAFIWQRGRVFERLDRAIGNDVCTLKRMKLNCISALRNQDGEWSYDLDILQSEAFIFYQNLYGREQAPLKTLPPNSFPNLDSRDIKFLGKCVLYDVTKKALFDMAPLKASSNDSYHALFF
ncbi:LINE-1 reverse transcriptase [Gossypium australe]|uniref:LINE-1 reverse transcriptase n=1 Tax=Gossypium australe TaxID=47621 RepID=A0A5B6VZW4_9ROSI|nr:LINE-1 reverse transcriptase [Gossypium australe]